MGQLSGASPHKRSNKDIPYVLILCYIGFMSRETINEEWDVLTKFFPDGWQEKAYEMGALVRRKKIDSASTLLRLLLIHLADGKSLRTTAAYAHESGLCDVNDVAILHRLRASGDWMLWMANELRDQVHPRFEPISFSDKFQVRLIDASMVSEPGATGSNWRLHYSLRAPGFRCDAFTVTGREVGEKLENFTVRPNELLVADRAYCTRSGIVHALKNDAHVLVRFHSTSVPLLNYRQRPYDLLTRLRALEPGAIGDWNVYFVDHFV